MSPRPVRPPSGEDLQWAILARIIVDPATGCWIWQRAKQKGYGAFQWGGRGQPQRRAHRAAWEAWRGPIPARMEVCHRCDVRACCNPDHLFLGTHQDNMRDMTAKGYGRAARHLQRDAKGRIIRATGPHQQEVPA